MKREDVGNVTYLYSVGIHTFSLGLLLDFERRFSLSLSHEVRKELGLLEEKLELLGGVGGRGSGSGAAGIRHVRARLISENYKEKNIFNTRICICCRDFRCYALLANAVATLNASEAEAVYVPP